MQGSGLHIQRRGEGFVQELPDQSLHGVFTKLRALEQHEYEKVLFLDLDILVRGDLADVFRLRAPAAMKRGEPVMEHGELVPYATLWGHPTRREADRLPQYQQASGINVRASAYSQICR